MTKTPFQSRRVAFDRRADSQLAWLQRTATIFVGDPSRAPSYSQLVRRAVDLYTEHMSGIIVAARMDDRSEPHPSDVSAERQALAEHARLVDAAPPGALVDQSGRLLDWQEAISRSIDLGLTIPGRGAE